MCGRFTLTYRERERLAFELGVPVEEIPPDAYKPRWNIAPTDPHWIVRLRLEDRHILPAKWGLVNSWAKDAKRAAAQINARAETLARSPAFRDAFRERRCVVPADGFFEWIGAGKERQPIWFHRPEGGLIYFAGLCESWQPEPGQWQRTFTIITTTPNALVAPVHNRMPVILPEDRVDDWLDQRQEDLDRLATLLAPPPEALMIATPVSQRVNSVKNDDPACLEPVSIVTQQSLPETP
jgi:putative SOS response-associated peptidase YedK